MLENALRCPRAKKKRSAWTVVGSPLHDCAPMAIMTSLKARRVFSRSLSASKDSVKICRASNSEMT